jgi:hypothetical protein
VGQGISSAHHGGLAAARIDLTEVAMFTHIGLPQFGLIVLVLIVFIVYTQRHRF